MKQRSVWGVILAVGIEVTLITLGIWQVQRLDWKNKVIEDIRSAERDPGLYDLDMLPRDQWSDLEYRNVTIDVDILTAPPIYWMGGVYKKKPGGLLALPAKTQDGSVVMVVDRWCWAQDITNCKPNLGHGKHTIQGKIRRIQPTPMRLSVVKSDLSQGMIYAMNQQDIQQYWPDLDVSPWVVFGDHGLELREIWQQQLQRRMHSPHLNYAITWFGLALVWPVILVLRFRRSKKKG